jgi:4-alpha-glucanotransferase
LIPSNYFDRRRSGILLHPTSLPGRWGNGDLGAEAYRFVDFLQASGQTIWQILPLGPTHFHGSPYQSLSVHAGNHLLISIADLMTKGWLDSREVDKTPVNTNGDNLQFRYHLLESAYSGFCERAEHQDQVALQDFIAEEHSWLEDYALYQALRKEHDGKDWSHWPAQLRDRKPAALKKARSRLLGLINQIYFEQYVFYRQWSALKTYANQRNVLIFGDMPIFVDYDSSDVWVHRDLFELDEKGKPTVVTGVPPDYFSATGQRWGNPHYRWQVMLANDFHWWKGRIKTQLKYFDLIRIDHFRGFEAYWEIPADHLDARGGHWVKAPGDQLFQSLREYFGELPLVAEDLGLITPEVKELRERYHLPGMKILQFAFDSDWHNPYLPHNHEPHMVIYTGTHDNDTTLGWFRHLSREKRQYVNEYLGNVDEKMPWPMIRCALASVARMAIIPMQDILMLGGEHRMNTPGTTSGNWKWRFEWQQMPVDTSEHLRHYTQLYGRIS